MPYFTSAERLSDLFTTQYLIFHLAISLVNAVFLMLISYKFLQIMQQSGYEGFGYFKWLRRRDNVYLSRLTILSIMSFLAFLMVSITLSFVDESWVFYIGFIFYISFILIYFKADKKQIKKVPIVYTARMKRLIATYAVVLVLVTYLLLLLVNVIAFLLRDNTLLIRIRYAPVCLLPIVAPILVLLAYYITKPYERSIQKKYIKRCKELLNSRGDLIKIGITGSYGKTSVKEILRTILQEKYEVLATPSSYNTPMGICKTTRALTEKHQIFIAEMGARHVGDIAELAEIVKPNYSIITGITSHHIETFGSIESIKKTKYELVEGTKEGKVAYTVDSEITASLFVDQNPKFIPTGLDVDYNPEVYAKDIKLSNEGSTFTLVVGDKSCDCSTKLLGSHNVSNICLAVAICIQLGMTINEISAGISRLSPVSHRLEVIKSRGVTIIDDSYNCNVAGIDAALKVLNEFEGRKIVVTPGLVELGYIENVENYKFGKKLAYTSDVVVLVGRSASFYIKDGLVDGGFNPENIIVTKDLATASKKLGKLLKAGDVVLFENDLPDKFS